MESFNGKLRDELLRAEVFNTLREAQVLIEQWRQHYCLASHARPPDPPNSRRLFGRGVSGLRTPHPRPVPHKSEESWGSPSQSSQVRSGPKVATWMARHRGLALVHPQLSWEALKRIEWSIRAPRPRHARATTPAQRVASKRADTVGEVAVPEYRAEALAQQQVGVAARERRPGDADCVVGHGRGTRLRAQRHGGLQSGHPSTPLASPAATSPTVSGRLLLAEQAGGQAAVTLAHEALLQK